MAIIKLNNNSLTSVTALPSGLGSDPDLKVDVARLGLRVFANQNLAKQNSTSSSYDVFQDSTGVTALTNCARDSAEFMGTSVSVTDSNLYDAFDYSSAGVTGAVDSGTQYKNGINSKIRNNIYPSYGHNFQQDHPFVSGGYCMETRRWDNSDGGSYVQWLSGHSDSINIGTGAFCIELFIKVASSGWSTSSSNKQYIFSAGSNTLNLGLTSANDTDYGGMTSDLDTGTDDTWTGLNDGNWHHLGICRDSSGNAMYFRGGNRKKYGTSSYNFNDSAWNYVNGSSFMRIGMYGTDTKSAFFRYDQFRLSVGTHRYDPTQSTYTVPTAIFGTTTTSINTTGSFEGVAITASSTSKMGAVITYKNNAGTNALNTDIILKLSADNGSNYTTATLVDNGNLDSTTKVASVSDVSVTAGTQLKYKIEFANQAEGSKEARITGVALQY